MYLILAVCMYVASSLKTRRAARPQMPHDTKRYEREERNTDAKREIRTRREKCGREERNTDAKREIRTREEKYGHEIRRSASLTGPPRRQAPDAAHRPPLHEEMIKTPPGKNPPLHEKKIRKRTTASSLSCAARLRCRSTAAPAQKLPAMVQSSAKGATIAQHPTVQISARVNSSRSRAARAPGRTAHLRRRFSASHRPATTGEALRLP